MSPRIVTADEVAPLIADGATVASDGFTMMSVADEIYLAVEQSFLSTGHPRGPTWVHAAGQSTGSPGSRTPASSSASSDRTGA